ncbi:hypothetical protein [Halorubrum spindle-shaped virus-BLv25]|nr:hypothetical protein [Halorubrum spindle-shaped virus-BLv25]
MIETIKNTDIRELCSKRTAVSIFLVSLVLFSGIAIAQSQISQTDDFEDQSVDGWESPAGETPEIQNDGGVGDYSLYATTSMLSSQDQAAFRWQSGPILDTSDSFTASGVMKTSLSSGTATIRVGLSGNDQNAEGENVYLIVDHDANTMYLATATGENPSTGNDLGNSYENQYVNFELSSNGEGNITGKVWEVGSQEPESPQLELSGLDGTAALFGVNPGYVSDSGEREIYLDEITVQGTEAIDPSLILDAKPYMDYGTEQQYSVTELVGDTDSYSAIRTDVTANATVSSTDTNVIQVDENTNTLTATDDTSVNQRVPIRAEYNGSVAYTNVTVASTTVDNVAILPGWRKVSAVFLDNLFQVLIGATLIAIAATRIGGAFAGISVLQLSMTIGWLIGWVPIGMALVSLFASLFIGLNLAANIDYTVRR